MAPALLRVGLAVLLALALLWPLAARADGLTVVPVSQVSFGFVAGGGEYALSGTPVPLEVTDDPLPFAGGTGAGVNVRPVAFLIVGNGQVRLLPAQNNTSVDRLIEMIPQIFDDVKSLLPGKKEHPLPPA